MSALQPVVTVRAKAGAPESLLVDEDIVKFIRYPGGKQRLLKHILPHLPNSSAIRGKFVEPFVGGGAVFLAVNPKSAVLADLNNELIELYLGIRDYPHAVWKFFHDFPGNKAGYYRIRKYDADKKSLAFRAARTLYLNRTCFKGMWRHNAKGEFNVGYGGQDRRWVINGDNLSQVAQRLRAATVKCCDFEVTIDQTRPQDFIFADPPYCPGKSDLFHSHYTYGQFTFADHERLAKALRRATLRGVKWAMTTSSHPSIVGLFGAKRILSIPVGTGKKPGLLTRQSGEILLLNY